MSELGQPHGDPVPLTVSHSSMNDTEYTSPNGEKSKHIERRHFWLRELSDKARISFPTTSSLSNISNFFTKPLSQKQFLFMRDRIMNTSFRVSPDTRNGGVSRPLSGTLL